MRLSLCNPLTLRRRIQMDLPNTDNKIESLDYFLSHFEEYVNRYLSITDVVEDLKELPSLYGLFSKIYAIAKNDYDMINIEYEQVHSRIRTETRLSLGKLGVKLTERYLDDEVSVNEELVTFKKNVAEKKITLDMIKDFLTALSYKKDMLVQLSAAERQEKRLYQ